MKPYYKSDLATVYCADVLEALREMPDESVHCCVTSPPYWSLRDYNVEGQIGLEKTPEEYLEKMVAVLREVRRVLRKDGTLWLNLGTNYSGTVTNLADAMNRVLKDCFVMSLDSVSVASTSKGINISAENQGSPDGVLLSFLGSQWMSVKDRHNDFHEVLDFLAIPGHGSLGCALLLMLVKNTAADLRVETDEGSSIVFSDLNSDLKSKLAVLRPASTRASKGYDGALPVKKTCEPSTKFGIRWHSTWDALSLAASSKGIPNVNMVNQSIALRNGHLAFSCLFSDFRVAEASQEHVTFKSVSGGLLFTVSNVGHLWFSFQDGSVVPYRTIYEQSTRLSNRECAKQEIDMANLLKIALQEDGWISRQTIIWAKPNPMPESVTDRPTKAHEYVFLLTKAARYFYDSEAIREQDTGQVGKSADFCRDKEGPIPPGQSKPSRRNNREHTQSTGTRNKRSVWVIATQPYPEAHFATFPEKLVEPCVKAGTSERGCCAECGTPWRRRIEKGPPPPEPTDRQPQKRLKPGQAGNVGAGNMGFRASKLSGQEMNAWKAEHPDLCLGWDPTCDCGADVKPCTVLDPFGGSMTSGVVALKLGRRFIGIELNQSYLDDFGLDRLRAAEQGLTVKEIRAGQQGLF